MKHFKYNTVFYITIFIAYIVLIVFINKEITYVPEKNEFKELKSLFLSIGAPFIGSTAIIFSIIIFALQINNERLPHGLLTKLSKDKKLFLSFFLTVTFSIIISALSLISNQCCALIAIEVAITSIFIILFLFIYSYTRALKLINPSYQLKSIIESTKKDLFAWDKAIKRMAFYKIDDEISLPKYDLQRDKYFKENPHWTNDAKRGIIYCNSYANRLVEERDYEISEIALKSIVEINSNYIKSKGNTFLRRESYSDVTISQNKFIEDTLEEIRQNIQNALIKKDERFLISNFKTLKELHSLYSDIKYSDVNGERSVSNLAYNYLINGIEACIQHKMPDVLMIGIELLGKIACKEIKDCESEMIGKIPETISKLACLGILDKELYPVTAFALNELSNITIQLFYSEESDTRDITDEINKYLYSISETEIKNIDTSYSNFENIYYFNVSNKLREFVYDVSKGNTNYNNLEKIIQNIERWSTSIRITNKELFELALTNNSNFVFNIVYFIKDISKCLMILSKLNIIDDKLSKSLNQNSIHLISIYTFAKSHENATELLEKYKFTDIIFDLAVFSHSENLIDNTIKIRNILLYWGFNVKEEDKYRVLAKAIGGCIYISILLDNNVEDFILLVKEELNKYELTKKKRINTVDSLNNMINEYPMSSSIEEHLNALGGIELNNYLDALSKLILKNSKKS